MKDFKEIYSSYQERVDLSLREQLAAAPLTGVLKNAVEYALFPGGKRARPVFSLLIAHDLGVDPTDLVFPACAIEFLHISSLIHDDLPALDNDDFRRGVPTVHRQFSETTAILAGDALISLAFLSIQRSKLSDSIKCCFTTILARTFTELCQGQELDLNEKDAPWISVATLKTGKLYGAAAAFGGVFARDFVAESDFFEFGELLGVAYQALDDRRDGQLNDDGELNASKNGLWLHLQRISVCHGRGLNLMSTFAHRLLSE